MVSVTVSALLLELESSHRQDLSERAWLCSPETFHTKTGGAIV